VRRHWCFARRVWNHHDDLLIYDPQGLRCRGNIRWKWCIWVGLASWFVRLEEFEEEFYRQLLLCSLVHENRVVPPSPSQVRQFLCQHAIPCCEGGFFHGFWRIFVFGQRSWHCLLYAEVTNDTKSSTWRLAARSLKNAWIQYSKHFYATTMRKRLRCIHVSFALGIGRMATRCWPWKKEYNVSRTWKLLVMTQRQECADWAWAKLKFVTISTWKWGLDVVATLRPLWLLAHVLQ